MPLDRSNPMPLWAQLEAELRSRMSGGDFAGGFPTDRELTSAYGVSRNTVREAVRHLGEDGLVERRRGSGTTVVKPELEQSLGSLYSLHGSLEAQGAEPSSQVRALAMRKDADAARKLGLPPGADLVYLERLRLAGEAPLALDRAWLPAQVARPLLQVDFASSALYEQLSARCGIEVVGGEERIHPAMPSGPEQLLLGIPSGQAAFLVERLVWSAAGPVELRTSLVRGDRFSFVARWSGAGARHGTRR